MSDTILEVKHLKKYFNTPKGTLHAVDDVSFTLERGKTLGIVGESGCGKSTTLFMLAGLNDPTSGHIYFGGKDVTKVAPEDREIGLVFQNYALYPHMTVEKNISYGLKNMKVPADEIKKKVDWAIDILGLEEYRYRKPKNLSGGQRQRVLLARALCATKKLLLLDEPVTGLDPIVTAEFYQLISRINKESGIAVVMVSHDIESAVEYASHILHLQETVLYFGKADGYEKSRAGKTFLGGETHV